MSQIVADVFHNPRSRRGRTVADQDSFQFVHHCSFA